MADRSEMHRKAVENFELVMLLCRRVGTTFALGGLVLWVAEFVWLSDAPSGSFHVWLYFIRSAACQMGLYLLGIAYLYPRFYPAHRKPVSEMDQQEYRRFLYGFGRPLKEHLRDMWYYGWPMLLPLIVFAAAMIAYRVLPKYQQVITGIAILAGFGAFVIAAWMAEKRGRGAVDRWYAANFPGEAQEKSPSRND